MSDGERGWDCNCLCVVNHAGERGICTNEVDREVAFFVPPHLRVRVAMCAPCAAATLAAAERARSSP